MLENIILFSTTLTLSNATPRVFGALRDNEAQCTCSNGTPAQSSSEAGCRIDYFTHNEATTITADKELGTVNTETDFELEFQLEITSAPTGGWKSVVHVGTTECSRQPAVSIHPNGLTLGVFWANYKNWCGGNWANQQSQIVVDAGFVVGGSYKIRVRMEEKLFSVYVDDVFLADLERVDQVKGSTNQKIFLGQGGSSFPGIVSNLRASKVNKDNCGFHLCDSAGQEKCTTCNDPYFLSLESTCVDELDVITCTCNNGTAALNGEASGCRTDLFRIDDREISLATSNLIGSVDNKDDFEVEFILNVSEDAVPENVLKNIIHIGDNTCSRVPAIYIKNFRLYTYWANPSNWCSGTWQNQQQVMEADAGIEAGGSYVIRLRMVHFLYTDPAENSNQPPTVNHRFTLWVNDLNNDASDFVELAQQIRWNSVTQVAGNSIYAGWENSFQYGTISKVRISEILDEAACDHLCEVDGQEKCEINGCDDGFFLDQFVPFTETRHFCKQHCDCEVNEYGYEVGHADEFGCLADSPKKCGACREGYELDEDIFECKLIGSGLIFPDGTIRPLGSTFCVQKRNTKKEAEFEEGDQLVLGPCENFEVNAYKPTEDHTISLKGDESGRTWHLVYTNAEETKFQVVASNHPDFCWSYAHPNTELPKRLIVASCDVSNPLQEFSYENGRIFAGWQTNHCVSWNYNGDGGRYSPIYIASCWENQFVSYINELPLGGAFFSDVSNTEFEYPVPSLENGRFHMIQAVPSDDSFCLKNKYGSHIHYQNCTGSKDTKINWIYDASNNEVREHGLPESRKVRCWQVPEDTKKQTLNGETIHGIDDNKHVSLTSCGQNVEWSESDENLVSTYLEYVPRLSDEDGGAILGVLSYKQGKACIGRNLNGRPALSGTDRCFMSLFGGFGSLSWGPQRKN